MSDWRLRCSLKICQRLSREGGKTAPSEEAASSRRIQNIYLFLLLLHTLAASFIWGINTLFLLDAGLTNLEAFAANAFFTAGFVLFEVPTGVLADTRGRRASYLYGTVTLIISTLFYLLMWRVSAPFWAWAFTSLFLGLGFTFFSGAVEAWLVDALRFSGFKGSLDGVFAKGEIIEGSAMLGGSIAGGVLAEATNLGIPYLVRAVILCVTFAFAFFLMRDTGFIPSRGKHLLEEVRSVLRGSLRPDGSCLQRLLLMAFPFTLFTRCSLTCWSCTATIKRTASPGWPLQRSVERRSPEGCSCPGSPASFAGALRYSWQVPCSVLPHCCLSGSFRTFGRPWSF